MMPPSFGKNLKKVFMRSIFPQGIQFQKYRKFDRLEQGDMTVAQYAAKFEEMSRYALTLISEDSDRARKFENGLRGRIQQQVAAFELSTYKDVVNKALVIEKGLDNAQVAREKNMKKRFRPTDSPSQNSRPSSRRIRDRIKLSPETEVKPEVPLDATDVEDLISSEIALGLEGHVFSWGQEGHKAIVCPNGTTEATGTTVLSKSSVNRAPQERQQQERGQQRPRTQGRVYALTEQDAKGF
ncbi:uncharacterized protein LOC120104805 [Phoenix dactylifera]|uniref:Uncharacterized protein LOC120104805 n=1 Tax=Phoenix dactylifera TaxID=42345 RepID=A0A8B8ZLK8_PHODC|nr:uncharacterized protein LOC120104805 [Phoenix dactylifera]